MLIRTYASSAGGGGRSKERIDKLRMKNQRLKQQRVRKAQQLLQQKVSTKPKNTQSDTIGQDPDQRKQALGQHSAVDRLPPIDHGDIHPSRRSIMGVLIQTSIA